MLNDKSLIGGLLALSIIIIGVGSLLPANTYQVIFQENGVIETLTALMYAAAAIVVSVAAANNTLNGGAARTTIGLILFALFALFLVAEEISIWTVFMSSEPPRILGIRMDAAHDLLHLGLKALKSLLQYNFVLGLVVIGAIGAVEVLILIRYRMYFPYLLREVRSTRVGTFILVCIVFGCIALIADLRSETILILKSVEESLELSGSIALLIAACIAYSTSQARHRVAA
jgi:hypothetical protein